MGLVTLAEMSATTAFVSQLAAFVLLMTALYFFVKPALGKILAERTKGIDDTFRKIELDEAQTREQISNFKALLADLDDEAKRRLKAAIDEAQKAGAQALSEANSQADAELHKAQREIQIEREKAILELRHETTRQTLEAADLLVQKSMNDARQAKMVEAYLAKLDSVKKS